MRAFIRTFIAASLVISALGCSSASSSGTNTAATPKANPDLITTGEIDSQPFRDAYDIVQMLRPTWFSNSATRSWICGNKSRRWRRICKSYALVEQIYL